MAETVMQVLADETGGKSYKAFKYGLDNAERPFIDYSEDNIVWEKSGETEIHKTYVDLEKQSKAYAKSGYQLFTYFLDGSRRVYKVDDQSYTLSGGRSGIYPIIAGQIGVGCCKRENKIMKPERFEREVVISVPDIADADGRPGFFQAMAMKLNRVQALQRMGIVINAVIPYSTSKGKDDKFEVRGTACIQDRMIQSEKDMVADLVKKRKVDSNNYLIKDGSLEYRPTKEILKDPRKKSII